MSLLRIPFGDTIVSFQQGLVNEHSLVKTVEISIAAGDSRAAVECCTPQEVDAIMDDKQLCEEVLSRETVYPGVIIRLEHWQVRLPNGEPALREVARHPGAAAVVALDEQGQVILVRQHRVAVGRVTLEIPAGKLDSPTEDPFVCAQRELSEETGLTAASWRKLTCLETTVGFCDERIHIYLATGLQQGDSHPDEDEFVSVLRLPLAEAVQRVMAGEIRDAKTALALLMTAQSTTIPIK